MKRPRSDFEYAMQQLATARRALVRGRARAEVGAPYPALREQAQGALDRVTAQLEAWDVFLAKLDEGPESLPQ
jgi:hypothetical protein